MRQLWSKKGLCEILLDPFSLYAIALDELWSQAERVLRIAAKIFGDMERVSDIDDSYSLFWLDTFQKIPQDALMLAKQTNARNDRPDLPGLHNMAKHIVHVEEAAEAASSTGKLLFEHHRSILRYDPSNRSINFVHQKLRTRIVQFEV